MVLKVLNFLDMVISEINKNLAFIGISLGVILAFANVFMRYAFDTSWTWAGELTNYLFIWAAFFGAAHGFREGVHIGITILVEKMPIVVAKIVMLIATFISLVYLLFIAYHGADLIILDMELGEMSVDLNIPTWISYMVIPVAFFTASIQVLRELVLLFNMSAKEAYDSIGHNTTQEIRQTQGELS